MLAIGPKSILNDADAFQIALMLPNGKTVLSQ